MPSCFSGRGCKKGASCAFSHDQELHAQEAAAQHTSIQTTIGQSGEHANHAIDQHPESSKEEDINCTSSLCGETPRLNDDEFNGVGSDVALGGDLISAPARSEEPFLQEQPGATEVMNAGLPKEWVAENLSSFDACLEKCSRGGVCVLYVRLTGLKSSSYNGCCGEVVGYDTGRKRFGVRLHGVSKPVRVKRASLCLYQVDSSDILESDAVHVAIASKHQECNEHDSNVGANVMVTGLVRSKSQYNGKVGTVITEDLVNDLIGVRLDPNPFLRSEPTTISVKSVNIWPLLGQRRKPLFPPFHLDLYDKHVALVVSRSSELDLQDAYEELTCLNKGNDRWEDHGVDMPAPTRGTAILKLITKYRKGRRYDDQPLQLFSDLFDGRSTDANMLWNRLDRKIPGTCFCFRMVDKSYDGCHGFQALLDGLHLELTQSWRCDG